MSSSVPSVEETLQAVKVLARAGISDEAIGRAVREYVLTAQPLRSAPLTSLVPPVSPLTALKPSPTPAQPATVPLAVPSAPRSPGPLTSPAPAPAAQLVPLKVRFADGVATNIVVPATLLERIADKLGGMDAARKLARDLAKVAPVQEKRSAWVVAELSKELAP